MVSEGSNINDLIQSTLASAGVDPSSINIPEGLQEAESNRQTRLDGELKGQTLSGKMEAEAEEATHEEVGEDETGEAGEEEGGEATKPTAITTEEVNNLISRASSNLQSMVDKKLNTISQQLYQTMAAINQLYQTQDDANISNLPADEQVMKRLERLEKGNGRPTVPFQIPQPAAQAQGQNLFPKLVEIVNKAGLQPNDPRIDWALDVNDAATGLSRFIQSVTAAQMADQTKAANGEIKKAAEKEAAKIRKKAGVDKVSISGPGGAGMPNLDQMSPFEKIEYALNQNETLAKT